MHKELLEITNKIIERSHKTRSEYLAAMEKAGHKPGRSQFSCSNLAHAVVSIPESNKASMLAGQNPNLGIVSAYNDMLSAHMPFVDFPALIKETAARHGATAQFAGGVPAMCDGVTQGRPGMELSLFSRDVIALSAAVALSHDVFDGAIFLGTCDKIVPGLVMAAASFGHLPSIFLPAGPMASGISNEEKSKMRQAFTKNQASKEELQKTEMQAYHSPGTCTFYGTANTNQMVLEFLGMQLPSSSFVAPYSDLRTSLTKLGVETLLKMTAPRQRPIRTADILSEKAFVNAIVGIHATGGSTNLVLHLIAMARAAGVILNQGDFAQISKIVPLLAKVYPNGDADVNHFHQAGGIQFVIDQLLQNGLLHQDVLTVAGFGLEHFSKTAYLNNDKEIQWSQASGASKSESILRPFERPFQETGGLARVAGNLGEAIVKVSALQDEHTEILAPAKVFYSQNEVKKAYKDGKLSGDFVCVVACQGPKANGMPECHSLIPILLLCQNNGQKVALLTDGRMSGASGKVLAAIHLSPEVMDQGPIGKIRDGDMIYINTKEHCLEVQEADFETRELPELPVQENYILGRNMFSIFRNAVGSASKGANSLFGDE